MRWHGNILLTRNSNDPLETELDLGRIALNLHLQGLLRALGVNCVLDVGANAGQYARNLRHLGYDGLIISFEPIPELYEALLASAHEDGCWRVLPYALGDYNGRAIFNVTPDSQFSSLLKPNAFAEAQFGEQVLGASALDVEVRRLDSLLGTVTRGVEESRIFLKMDTQGSDLRVFAGVGECARAVVGLQSEVSLVPIYQDMPSVFDVMPAFMQQGYAVTGMFPISKDSSGRVIEYDCVMIRNTH